MPRYASVSAMTASSRARHGAFISYARADGEPAAKALQARLAADAPDIPAWLDRYEIEGGVGWWTQIEKELDRAEFLLLLMTPAAMQSENTSREWRSARQRGVCVYPIKGVDALDFDVLPNWMRKAHFYDPDTEWPKLLAHLRRGCVQTRVPFMAPPLPPSFVARHRETEALIDLLRARGTRDPVAITTALRGAGGFGKTTLAAAICHDDRIIGAFDDGILWAALGQSPNLLNELVKLYAALTGERPGFVDVEDASRELTLKLEHKNCLIVIDDAWQTSHVAPFLRGGPGCARLITTRLFEVAAEARRVEVNQMAPAEAMQLLLGRAGVSATDVSPFRQLVARLGEWPLPLKLAGSAMRQRIERGDTTVRALDYVTRALDKRGITAFDKDRAATRDDAVADTVSASLDLLDTDDQRRCTELAVFPEDVAFPLSAAATLWQLDEIDSEELAHRLDDLALLEFDLRGGVLRLHDVLRAFLISRLPDPPAVHARLIDAWKDPYALDGPYPWRRYIYHLHHSGRHDQRRALLLEPRWLSAKLHATEIHSLLADFEQVADDRALGLIRDALRLSAPAVSADPQQICGQLNGRLLGRDEPEIVAFREAAAKTPASAWLRLLHPTLDAPGGMLTMTLVGHEGEVTALAADAEQRVLFSASSDGTVRVWDLREGRLLQIFAHRTLGAHAVAARDDGALAVSAGGDGLIYLWDVAKGERLHGFWGERGPAVRTLAMSADGRIAVSGSRDGSVKVWDVDGRACRRALGGHRGHREPVTSVAISADGRRAVSASDDFTLRVWDLDGGALERTLTGHGGPVNAVAMTRDGRHALSGSSDQAVKLWDLRSGSCLRTLSGHRGSVTAVEFAANAWRALSGSSDQTARLWDLNSGETLVSLEGHSDAINAVLLDAGGIRGATASVDRSVKIWRLDELRAPEATGAHAGSVMCLVFSPDGRLCASGGSDGRVTVRETRSGRVVRTIEAHTAPVRSLAFTADSSCVLSGGIENRYVLWTIDSGEGAWMPIRHTAPIDYCAFSATARYLATSCSDRLVYLWEVPSGTVVERYGTRRLFDHLIVPAPQRCRLPDTDEYLDTYLPGERIYDVMIIRVSRDGRYVVFSATTRDEDAVQNGPRERGSSSGKRTGACLLVLELGTGEIHVVTSAQAEPATAFALDAERMRLLWARADHSLELWDLRSERRLATLRGHTEKVNAVAFSGDGTRAMSCARDRSARVWHLDSGQQAAAFTADSALRSLALAPHDDTIAVGDVSGRVHLLRLEVS
jgi:WD40 repeat protein